MLLVIASPLIIANEGAVLSVGYWKRHEAEEP
jgi:hypothetical protein